MVQATGFRNDDAPRMRTSQARFEPAPLNKLGQRGRGRIGALGSRVATS
jgi:hypothetical protein